MKINFANLASNGETFIQTVMLMSSLLWNTVKFSKDTYKILLISPALSEIRKKKRKKYQTYACSVIPIATRHINNIHTMFLIGIPGIFPSSSHNILLLDAILDWTILPGSNKPSKE